MSSVNVEIMEDRDPFGDQIDSGDIFSIYHLKVWKNIIEDTFKHTGVYATAWKNESLMDVLPFFSVNKYFLGRKLISTPYEACNGGFTSVDTEVRKALIESILKYGQEKKVKYIEIRSAFPINELKEFGFIEKTPFVISEISLKGHDENFKILSPKHRRNVKIAQKKGVSVVPATRWDQMEAFYKILTDHYKNLGVPFFGKKFFKQIWEKLIENKNACLLLAKYDQKIIGGHLLFFSGKTLISKYSATKRSKELQKVNASYALFWEGIRLGIEKDFTKFNLGITGHYNTGLLDFKSRFGANNRAVHFYYYPISGKIPDFAKYYGKYSLLKKVWSVAPAILTSAIGQKINEWIC